MWKRLPTFIARELRIIEIKRRIRAEHKKTAPFVWLSQAQIIDTDLKLYLAEDGKEKVDTKFLDDLVKSRDDTLSIAKKQFLISGLINIFLFSNYFSLGIDFSAGGFSFKNAKGIQEALFVLSSGLALYTLILQSNVYLMDAHIKTIISFIVAPELQQLYWIRYFPHINFGSYQPFNIPYIVQPWATRFIRYRVTPILFLGLLATALFGWMSLSMLLLIDIWVEARLGIWSRFVAAVVFISGIYSLFYVLSTQIPLPHRDYFINLKFELVQQINPAGMPALSREVYGRAARLLRMLKKEQSGK